LERRDSARLTPREGRKFAFTVGTAFLVIASVLYLWRGHVTVPGVLAGLGTALLLAGLVIPGRLGPVWRAWMGLALILSKVTTPIFMSVVYYLVMTPTGILRRLIGKNPVEHVATDGSYWAPRPDGARRSDLQRQF
jgi:hypothetical protein